jgi:hypothetical protein
MAAQPYKAVTQLFSESSIIVRRNLRLFIILNIIAILNTAWTVGRDLRGTTSGAGWRAMLENSYLGSSSGQDSSAVFGVAAFVLTIVLSLMATILAVKAVKGGVVAFEDVWDSFKRNWWRMILVVLVLILLVIPGLILLIIPGLYIASRLSLALYILIDQNTGVMEAVNKSWALTKGRAWPVFTAVFFGVLLNIPSVIPIVGPIVALVLTILYACGGPLRYFEYKKAK